MTSAVSSVVRWVQNQGGKGKNGQLGGIAYPNQSWVHPPDALNYGRVDYTVKFLGEVEASAPKGTQVVKEAVHKIRFQLQLRRAQGYKLPKVEIQINTEGLSVVDPKSRAILYRYPLHRISFCADDKQDKRVFAFIAKQADSSVHNVFVFLSDKSAEEITLTIGEAFDLAYRKFLDGKGKDLETKKISILLQRRIKDLEAENDSLRVRLAKYEPTGLGESRGAAPVDLLPIQNRNGHSIPIPGPPNQPLPPLPISAPTGPQRAQLNRTNEVVMGMLAANGPDVGRKLENLRLDQLDDLFDNNFDPRAGEKPKGQRDAFGLEPFGVKPVTNGNIPGVEQPVNVEPTQQEIMAAIDLIDSRLAEMRDGFAAGLSIGDDLNCELTDLDANPNVTKTN